MQITGIEAISKKKNRVFVDGEYVFMLYDRDIAIYGLNEGEEISEEKYRKIILETVLRRAKQKALYILERGDKSVIELRRKLKQDMYTEDIIDRTIEYIDSFHYLDDLRYACNFIRSHRMSSSRREIETKLMGKGVDKEIIAKAFSDTEEEFRAQNTIHAALQGTKTQDDINIEAENEDVEKMAAISALRKKLNGRNQIDAAQRQKVMGYMFRKGFRIEDIFYAFEALGVSCEKGQGEWD